MKTPLDLFDSLHEPDPRKTIKRETNYLNRVGEQCFRYRKFFILLLCFFEEDECRVSDLEDKRVVGKI